MSGEVMLNVASGFAWALPGAYLAWHRPRVAYGWLALVAGGGHWLAAGLEATSSWERLADAAEVVEQPVLMAMYALFPDGRLPRSRLQWPSIASLVLAVAGVGVAAYDVELLPALFAPSALLALAVLALRWKDAPAGDRAPLRWLLVVGIAVTCVTVPAVALLPTPQGATVGLGLTFVEITVVVAATLRHHVYGIDVVLSRTLLYLLLTGAVAFVFVVAVSVAALADVDSDRIPAFAAAAVSLLLLAPARSWLQRKVDRLVWGSSGDPYRVVAELTADFASASSPQAVISSYVANMRDVLRVPWVELSYGEPRRVATSGTGHGASTSFPLLHRGRQLGELTVGLRRGETALRRRERRLVGDLAAHAALAVESVTLANDLQESREQVVAGREEERRRLRMDLHDGLGPQLTGIALGLDAISERVDDPDIRARLEMLHAELIDALGNVRRLVAGLRPPRLDDVGLVGAIAEAADRASRGGLVVDFARPDHDQPRLPAAVEVAMLRIAEEAITNVVRHAGATTCTVALRLAPDVVLEVSDDGHAAPRSPEGTGLESMRHRAEELGGTLVARPRSRGGWQVTARIPVPAHEELATHG